MDFRRKPYRVEVWEEHWKTDSANTSNEQGGYWEEVRSVVIGDSNSDFQGMLYNPILIRNVDGTITFTFSINDGFYEGADRIENYLLPYLFNEVKIKLYYDEKWYDFVIKEIDENHSKDGLRYDFSCEYLPINELAKNGWELNFSLDQSNCIGTIDYFANQILKGTDWTYKENKDCDLTEYSLEYLYKTTLLSDVDAVKMANDAGASTNVTLPTGAVVYVPYTQIDKLDGQDCYVLYSNSYAYESDYVFSKEVNTYSVSSGDLKAALDANKSLTEYYGYVVKATLKSIWEPELNRYVNVYDVTRNGKAETYYGYLSTRFEVFLEEEGTGELTPNLGYKQIDEIKYYKHTDKDEPYKIAVIGNYGKPTDQTAGIESQLYVDTQTGLTYELIKGVWTERTDVKQNTYAIGQETIAYYRLDDDPSYTIKSVYIDNNKKQRSLIQEKSNRFNLIQQVAELFEVWAKFEIEHEKDGRIKIDSKTGLPIKTVSFVSEIGKNNGVEFNYDINISSIQRTVDSTSLTTKLWVEQTENENAKSGTCSIQRAEQNESGELFIINLDYYAQTGMINRAQLIRDLYGTSSSDFGYLYKLGQLNKQIDGFSEKNNGENGISYQLRLWQEKREFYNDEIITYRQKLDDYPIEGYSLDKQNNITYDGDNTSKYPEASYFKDSVRAWVIPYESETEKIDPYTGEKFKIGYNSLTHSEKQNLSAVVNELFDSFEKATENWRTAITWVDKLTQEAEALQENINDLNEQKIQLNRKFYNIYSRYLQEGTWSDDSYLDDNAYFYDAKRVALESSRPAVTYNIDVINIAPAFEYEMQESWNAYNFDLGDRTYIVDTDYFGYLADGITPYKEKVVVSEIQNQLDDPKSDTITIQNYKTSFEDLFQRTTATVQSYELNKNVYSRAEAITATNEIKYNTLQNTFANNSFILANSKNNTVIVDSTGIEVADLNDYSKKVRIVAGGIFISNDGGLTWNLGISGEGINTKYLLAGRIDVEQINIMNGSFPTFSWDKYGINAYSWQAENYINYGSFIRYDEFGLYGIRNSKYGLDHPFYPERKTKFSDSGEWIEDVKITDKGTAASLEDAIIDHIQEESFFSLTWQGFNLKTNSGSVEIDSTNDFRVLDPNGTERVKIGALELPELQPDGTVMPGRYGLRLSDTTGVPVLESNTDGNLSLTGKIYLGDVLNSTSGNLVAIGGLGQETIVPEYNGERRVILVQKSNNDPTFVVYESGDIFIKGGISADIGNIGGFVIDQKSIHSKEETIILAPTGITIDASKNTQENFTGFIIKNKEGDTVFSTDENGNIIANNITVKNGDFSGSVTATRALLQGSMILGTKTGLFSLASITNVNVDTKTFNGSFRWTNGNANLNNYIGNYIFTQFNINGLEVVGLFILVNVISSTQVQLKLIYSNGFNLIDEDYIAGLINENSIFYAGANDNIVLDGRTGEIYTFDYFLQEGKEGYRFNGDGTINAQEAVFGNGDSQITIDKDGISIDVSGQSSFSVTNNGKLTTNSINIEGNDNNYITGTLYVGDKNNGIYIDGVNGDIYNNNYLLSSGASSWIIKRDGSAIFNDVTVRGRIESSTFVQGEVQALSGTLVIRPTLTFVDNSTIIYNTTLKNYQGYVNEEPGEPGIDYYQSSLGEPYGDCRFLLTSKQKVSDGSYFIGLKRVSYLGDDTLSTDINGYNQMIELPLINLGGLAQNAIGISLNATNHDDSFGFGDSITIYDQGILSDDNGVVTFTRNNRLIMGRLPVQDFIPVDMQGSFGLYADNVYLKGAMVSAAQDGNTYITSGINTNEINGNVFWAGAEGGTANEAASDEAIADAPFRVTRDGYLYARKGVFEGTVRAARIYTAELIGRDENAILRILNNPSSKSYITFEDYTGMVDDVEQYNVMAKLGANAFNIGAPFKLFNSSDFTTAPILLSINQLSTVAIDNFLTYDFEGTTIDDCYTSGWGFNEQEFYYKKIQNDSNLISNVEDYEGRINEFLTNTANVNNYSIKALDSLLEIDVRAQAKIKVKESETEFYNAIILGNMEEGIKNNLKVYTEYSEADDKNVVKGYDLFIEES